MTTESRFDEAILKQADLLVKEIAAHKEVRSVAVVIDWALPNQTGLANSLWHIAPDQDPLLASIQMSAQLGRTVVNQQNTALRIIEQAMVEISKQRSAEQKVQDDQVPAASDAQA